MSEDGSYKFYPSWFQPTCVYGMQTKILKEWSSSFLFVLLFDWKKETFGT